MFTILTAIAGTLIGVLVTRIMVKAGVKTVTNTVTNFTCSYCKVDVVGAKQLDLINHIPCINKSEEDLETMRKNAVKKKADEYYIDYTRAIYRQHMARPSWVDDDPNYEIGGTWWMIKWTVLRNGEEIKSAHAKSMATCKSQADKWIELDKYKRRNDAA